MLRFDSVSDAPIWVDPPDGAGSYVAASVIVGTCVAENVVFSVEAGLTHRNGDPACEYYFVSFGQYPDGIKYFWKGSDLPWYISRYDRLHIVDGVCRATEALLKRASPFRVFRVTNDVHDESSPGLAKHQRVSLVFNHCGYEFEETSCNQVSPLQWVMRKIG
jgi:hypothetical protein